MEILIPALILGLMGSFHCIGMCGPIALSLPLRGDTVWEKTAGGLLYNIGRTITYGMMGAFFGLIGQGFHLLGFQQWISVSMGGLMILSVLLPSLFKNRYSGNFTSFTRPLRSAIQRLFQTRSYKGLFMIGVLNGLLPCGLVYLAIAGAIGTGSLPLSIGFMVVFGLGTLPMMLAISWLGNMFSIALRNKINKVIPSLIVLIGILFILRGLTLGIPFLSPPAEKMSPAAQMHSTSPAGPAQAIKHACCQPDSTKK